MNKYIKQLNELFDPTELSGLDGSKFEFLAAEIFDFTTYDSEVDILWSKRMIEVLEAILNRKTFDYIQSSKENYYNYLTMCNMPFLADKLEWGGSIRGAWFDCSEYDKEDYDFLNIQVPKKEFKLFVTQLLIWVSSS